MISKIISVSEKVAPKIAKCLGLQPTFVFTLIMLFSGLFYGMICINRSFDEQNNLIRQQIALTQAHLDSLGNRVGDHEVRIASLENKYTTLDSKVDNLSVRFAQQEAKMDLVSSNLRDISIQLMRRK